MNRFCLSRKQLTALICFVVAGAAGLAGQAKPGNLFKEVADRQAKIVWKAAPANAIPPDVCTMLAVCGPGGEKLIAMPKATEGGQMVSRVLMLSHDAKKAEVVVLLRQTPGDAYFFAVGPDGALQKAAYYATGKPWVPMGTALSRPVFEKDAAAWITQVDKIAAGNAAPAPAAPAAEEPKG